MGNHRQRGSTMKTLRQKIAVFCLRGYLNVPSPVFIQALTHPALISRLEPQPMGLTLTRVGL